MNEPKNKKALETGSGIAWKQWLVLLAPHTALDHTAMAKVVLAEIIKHGAAKSPEWWAQAVTIAYEQHIGRRQSGQTCDGQFSVTVSRTIEGDMDDALASWQEMIGDTHVFAGVAMQGKARISQTEKWRYWRCNFNDGSVVSVNIQTKPSGKKSSLAINHDKLSTAHDVEQWRAYWKQFGRGL